MIDLQLERKKLELVKVSAAKEEMKFRIMELKAAIEKTNEQIEIQDKRIRELKQEIGE